MTLISSINNRYLFLVLILVMAVNTYSLRSNPIFITQSDSYHIVKKGDTLFSISRKHSLSVEQLRIYNNLSNDSIIIGQKIYLTPVMSGKTEYVTQRPIPEGGYHIVQRGETVYRISKMYNLEIMEILEYNNLESFDIQTGQKIWLIEGKISRTTESKTTEKPEEIPTVAKEEAVSYHTVARGENLYRISLKYGMTIAQLKELNNLKSDDLNVGQKLRVTGEAKPVVSKPTPSRPTVSKEELPHKRGSLQLPVKGKVVSEFGIRNKLPHNGIDIAAPIGEPILAALAGKVVFVGVQRGYGNVVVLEHDNLVMTVYAHNERNMVRIGDIVSKGQPIATVGQSGNAEGPHLHFEYRVKGKAINPRLVLGEL